MKKEKHKKIQAVILVACLVILVLTQLLKDTTPAAPSVCDFLDTKKLGGYLGVELEALPEKVTGSESDPIKIVECIYQDDQEVKGAYFWIRSQPDVPAIDGQAVAPIDRVRKINRHQGGYVELEDEFVKYEDKLVVHENIGDGAVWDPYVKNVVFFKGSSILSLWITGLDDKEVEAKTVEFAADIMKKLEKFIASKDPTAAMHSVGASDEESETDADGQDS